MRALQMFPQRLDMVEVLLSSCGREVKEERGKVKVGFVEIWFRSFSNVSVPYVTLWWWGELSRVYCALFWWLLGLAPADLGSYEGLLVGLWALNSMGSKLLQLFILYCVTESRVKKRMIFECPLLDLRAPSAGSTVWDVFRLCLSVRFELLPQGLNGIWTCWSDSCCWVRWDKKRKNPELLWVSYRVTRTTTVQRYPHAAAGSN